jgi:hypothetical protein
VARLNYGSTIGPDKISYEAVRRFHAYLPHVLPRVSTNLFTSAIHPSEWKDAHCVVIPKPGKSTYQTASAYCSISLLSCFGKVFEAIAARRLSKAAAACGDIAETQIGARAQHSALDALLGVVDPVAYSCLRCTESPTPSHRAQASIHTTSRGPSTTPTPRCWTKF